MARLGAEETLFPRRLRSLQCGHGSAVSPTQSGSGLSGSLPSHQPWGPTGWAAVCPGPETAASRAALRQRCHQGAAHTPGLSLGLPRFAPRAVNPRAPVASLGAAIHGLTQNQKSSLSTVTALFSGTRIGIHQRQRHRGGLGGPRALSRRAGAPPTLVTCALVST